MRLLLLAVTFCSLTLVAMESPAGIPIPEGAVLKKVPPEYPVQARRAHLTGAGVLMLSVDRKTGVVTSVTMEKSTGHKILDDAGIRAFSQWRFKPGVVTEGKVKIPINFRMDGVRSRMAGAALDRAY
jgi:TonB family protein